MKVPGVAAPEQDRASCEPVSQCQRRVRDDSTPGTWVWAGGGWEEGRAVGTEQ